MELMRWQSTLFKFKFEPEMALQEELGVGGIVNGIEALAESQAEVQAEAGSSSLEDSEVIEVALAGGSKQACQ